MNTGPFQLVNIPPFFWDIPYEGSQYPGSPLLKDIQQGANCQRFAYAILQHFGKILPPFRSSDLWEDSLYTEIVYREWRPLDLFLWNDKPKAFGAHVGVYMGENQVIHLSKRVGFPECREIDHFKNIPSYQCFIGVKRVMEDPRVNL